ncbi:MAG: ATP-binding protein [Chloroflexota bacterium]|nr:ATP-binding protein [Chloroflexota bacterium]MDE2947609.1 ATP-binding protein [Chloroflexota bacterium]
MTIGLSVLEHLGIGLYSNVPAVLSEVVANAWDADAENVNIDVNIAKGSITISDDGYGMTERDINEKYLMVGYKKRDVEPNFGITPKGRQPMGRKGIGKLSVFSIANSIDIHSVKDNEVNAFRMDSNEIRAEIEQAGQTYYPVALPTNNLSIDKGTKIILTDLKKDVNRLKEHLRRRLSRRFSIIGKDDFNIVVDGESISPRDRDYYKFIQFLWYFGEESEGFLDLCGNTERPAKQVEPTIDELEERSVSGWVGTVKTQEQINEDINGIAIFANGKLVHENILEDMKEGGVWTKYIVGEIDANYMDDNQQDDMITSARQRLQEDDQRFIQLHNFLSDGVIKHIKSSWQKWRTDAGSDNILKERKNVKRWYDRLGSDQKQSARSLFGKIESIDGMEEESKKQLYKSSMYAFHRLAITDQLSILNQLETKRDFELISQLFGNLTDLARVQYYDIAKVRVALIDKFRKIIDDNQKEKVIQKHIFKALWLLDPSWERAATNARMEETVNKEFKNETAKLSEAEKRARIDIRYQTVSGKHVIIELKRYNVNEDIYTLLAQLKKYRNALEKKLQEYGDEYNRMAIETISVTGSRPRTADVDRLLIADGARWLTYNDLINNAYNSYKEYLQAELRLSELISIIESIDQDF